MERCNASSDDHAVSAPQARPRAHWVALLKQADGAAEHAARSSRMLTGAFGAWRALARPQESPEDAARALRLMEQEAQNGSIAAMRWLAW